MVLKLGPDASDLQFPPDGSEKLKEIGLIVAIDAVAFYL